MAITLPEARYVLRDTVLYCGTTFSPASLDVALLRSATRLIHEGRLDRGIVSATAAADNYEADFSGNAGYQFYWNRGMAFLSPGRFYFSTATYSDADPYVLTVDTDGTILEHYNFVSGDQLVLTGGTDANEATYTITAATSTTITVSASMADSGTGDNSDGDWTGYVLSGSRKWTQLRKVSIENIRGEYEKSDAQTGIPRLIAWAEPDKAWLYPIPDQTYTLVQPVNTPPATTTWTPGTHEVGAWSGTTTYRKGDVVTATPNATEYTYRSAINENLNNTPTDAASDSNWTLVGTTEANPVPTNASDVTFNIPDLFVYEWLGSGAVGDLLRHAPGHTPQVQGANAEFEMLIRRASDAAAKGDGVWYVDPNTDLDSLFGPQGLIGGDY